MADKQRPRVCAKQGGGLSTRTERRRRHDSKAVYAFQKFRNRKTLIKVSCPVVLLFIGVTLVFRRRGWNVLEKTLKA
jgi:hypothetical protein